MASPSNWIEGRAGTSLRASEPATPPLWECLFIVAAVTVYATDGFRLMFPGESNDASLAYRLAHFMFYGAFLALILRRPLDALAGLARAPALALLLALPMISVLWSISPQETAQRAIAVVGSSLLGVYLATEVERGTALRLIALAFTISAVVSVVLIAAVPSIGLSQEPLHPGAWAGAYGHKNGLGLSAALGAFICMLVALDRGPLASPLAVVGLVLNVGLLVGSRSLTGQIMFALTVAAVFLAGWLTRFVARHAWATTLAGGGAAIAAGTFVSADALGALVEAFGRDLTFSNRLPIWISVWPFVEAHPWLGYGYEAFWHDENYAVRVITGALHFRPWYAHNGLLELMLGLGALGVGVFAWVFVRFMAQAARLLHRDQHDPSWLLAFVFGVVLLVHNASENTILLRNSFFWSLFVMLALELAAASSAEPTEAARAPLGERPPILVS